MRIGDIDRFFEDLGRRLDRPVRILLTGGAAGVLQGISRATYDIDFEIRLRRLPEGSRRARDEWERVQKGIEATARATGITPQYDEDIDRWSSIALPVKRGKLYRRFGKVEVRILDADLWAIGKLTRFLSTDVQDLRVVLSKARVDPQAAVKLWGKALGISPTSSSQATFRKQVETFLNQYAQEIWGTSVDPAELKRLFLESARKARRKKI